MPDLDQQLPGIAKEFLSSKRGSYCRTQVSQFHSYIRRQNIDLPNITAKIVLEFLEQKVLLERTRRVYKCQLLTYLDFLFEWGTIDFDPKSLRIKPRSNAKPIPEQARAFVASPKGKSSAVAVRKFHEWLELNNLALKELSPDRFNEHLENRLQTIAPTTGSIYRLQLLSYLEFQYREKRINFDPAPLREKPKNCPIPEEYRHLLQTEGPAVISIARTFHKWMLATELNALRLAPEHITKFQEFRMEMVSEISARNSRHCLLKYLDILYSKQKINFNPAKLRRRPTGFPLPEQAKTFLMHHGVVTTESTLKYYQTSLRRFHKWLDRNKRELSQLKAFDLEEFAIHLKKDHLKTATRNGTLVCLRVYFRWLNEHGLLNEGADDLIKPETFPKLPHYLPRPL